MLTPAVLPVLGCGLLLSVWNLHARKSLNKSFFLWLCRLISAIVLLPQALLRARLPGPAYAAVLVSLSASRVSQRIPTFSHFYPPPKMI